SLSAASAVYAERNFAIKTDINDLISPDLPWARRVQEFVAAFPEREILAVVDAPTPELVEQAATRLGQALAARPDLFPTVRQPQSGSFFARNGLLYLPTDEVRRLTDLLTPGEPPIGWLSRPTEGGGGWRVWLTGGGPLTGTLAADVSLRGTLDALSLGLKGVQRQELTLDDMTRPLTMAADTAEAVLAGRPATFSWQV